MPSLQFSCGAGETYRYWNKFYPEDICTLNKCFNGSQLKKASAQEHKAAKATVAGETRYTYNMRLPYNGF